MANANMLMLNQEAKSIFFNTMVFIKTKLTYAKSKYFFEEVGNLKAELTLRKSNIATKNISTSKLCNCKRHLMREGSSNFWVRKK